MGTNNIDNEDEELFVTITLEDDSEIECEVLTIFEVEEEDGEIFIYRYFEDEDGEPGLDNIETQEEFDMVSEVFDSIVEDGEYDEIIEE